jgi:hypothetical protein
MNFRKLGEEGSRRGLLKGQSRGMSVLYGTGKAEVPGKLYLYAAI